MVTNITVPAWPSLRIPSPPALDVIDVSKWDNKINAQQLIDGGVVSVIVGIYKQWDPVTRKYVLNTNCRRICDQVKNSSLILQTYFYYYTANDPVIEANWYVDQMFINNYPVAYAWVDVEDHPVIDYRLDPPAAKALRSEQYRKFTEQVARRFPKVGLYFGRFFIGDWAPNMANWVGKYNHWLPSYYIQPTARTLMSWETLNTVWSPRYDVFYHKAMGPIVGHQFTGDKCYLPGVYDSGFTSNAILYQNRMALDVSVFKKEFIDSLGGTYIPPVIPPVIGEKYKIVPACINVRSAPVMIPATWVRYGYKDEVVFVIGNLTNGYVQLVDKTWLWQGYLEKVAA
jgi:GH25 family lysozyme M1 (1,4-beta-N-acetylmuramidase)